MNILEVIQLACWSLATVFLVYAAILGRKTARLLDKSVEDMRAANAALDEALNAMPSLEEHARKVGLTEEDIEWAKGRGREYRNRCPDCGHATHHLLGWCPNLASDNDCDCRRNVP